MTSSPMGGAAATASKCFIVLALSLSACTPPAYPYSVTLKPPANPYTGGNCRVRVEPLTFDPNATWGGKSEADFVASLRPEAQASHQGDLTGVPEEYFKWVKVNEPDYIGKRGTITTGTTGDEPFVVRARVVDVKLANGAMKIVNEVYQQPGGGKVGEFTVAAENAFAFGTGHGMRSATITLSMAVLSYFRDRFGCTGQPKIAN